MSRAEQIGQFYTDPKWLRPNKNSSKRRRRPWYSSRRAGQSRQYQKNQHHRLNRRQLKMLLEDAPPYNRYMGWWL